MLAAVVEAVAVLAAIGPTVAAGAVVGLAWPLRGTWTALWRA